MKRQILISSIILLLFTAGLATARTIHVPGAYPYIDIQQAINMANPGDVIVIAPGTYIGTGYYIDEGITITGTDPNNPYVVAATVIDFDGQDELAFHLDGAQNTLRGITIANSWRGWAPVSDGVNPGDDGFPGTDDIGDSGIYISGSHIVSNCIIRNCRQTNGPGGNGAAGDPNEYPGDPNARPVSYGGNGGKGGHGYGSGIYIDYGSPQILNTVIEDCIAIGGPGGAGGAGLDAAPPDPNIQGGPGGNGGNGGDAIGAGVYCSSGSPTFRNCIIRNCEVRAGDAADGNDGGDGIIEDFNSLFPGGDGGHGGVPGLARGAGVYCAGGVNATFTGCQFIGNRAYGADGGDGGNAGDIHLAMPWLAGGLGGLVEESRSQPGTPQNGRPPSDFSALGAGVYIEHAATATFTGCTFGDNVTRGSVSGLGGWHTAGRERPLKNFPIPSYGAGIYCDDFTTTTFTDCNIQSNWTTQEPNQYQGDLYPYGSNPSPDFQYAEVEYIGYGGGMCFIGGALGANFGYVELNHCNISDNNAPVGGGVCASALTHFHVDECNFVNNLAYLGGGLFSIDNSSTISKSTFSGNRAYDPDIYGSGGGLFSFSSDVKISDCIFSENTTNGYGAGIYMAGEVAIPPLTAEPVLKNCLLSDNKAGLDGGGIYCDWYTEPNIINCTITGNEARGDPPFGVGYGGGLYCSYGSDVNIINSIIWGNAGPNTIGPELAVETWFGFEPTVLTVSNCDVEGGEGEVWVDDYSTLNWGAGNIHINPLFATGPLGGYYLSQIAAGQDVNSPCVDSGSADANDPNISLDTYTTRTDSVPDVNIVDMGYHYEVGAVPQYSLTIEVVNGVGGSLFAQGGGDDSFTIEDPNTRLVNAGTVVSLQALADAGYSLRWTGTDNDTSTDPNNTVTMNSNKVVRVEFYQFTLTIEVYTGGDFEPNGTLIASSSLPTDPFSLTARDEPNSRLVTPGTVVDLTAMADVNYRVWWWSGTDDDASTAATNTVTMNSDRTVAVAFEPDGLYYLTVTVIGEGTVTPFGRTLHRPGEVVTLTAMPDSPSEIVIWNGTDDDFSGSQHNTVTMNAHREVTVEFYAPRMLYVPGDYPTIQAAIDATQDGDIIEISAAAEPYITSWGYEISGKAITITSTNPDDPCCVANTVIQKEVGPEGSGRSCFHFWNVGRNTVLNGLTLREFSGIGYDGLDGDPTLGFYDGVPGGDVAGGAIICYYNASPTIKNCIIRDCNIIGGDGGNGADGVGGTPPPPPHIDGGHGGWPGRAYGGGMAFLNGSSPLVLNCTFVNCSVVGGNGGDGGNGAGEPDCGNGGRGGGYYYSDPPRYPYDFGPFDLYTQYSGHGGAVYVGPGCSPEFIDCTFINNTSGSGTNGISGQYGCPPETRDEPSIRWKIDNFGGAVYVAENSTARFIGCAFNGNLADTNNLPESSDLFVSYGGAIAFEDGADLTIEDCTFNGNLATIGGGIYSSHSDPLIDDCSFVGNSAYHGGGALFVAGTVNITRSNFGENEATATAGQGGGICCLGANAGIVDCNIVNNDANGSGGGIYISSKNVNGQEVSGENTVLVENCLITGNFASRDGGGISANWHSEPNIVNCTIADNVVTGTGFEAGYGGGLCCSYGNYTNIINSIIWGNSGQRGPQLAIGSGFEYDPRPSTVNVSYSDVQGGQSYVFIDEDCTLNWGAGNIHINPLFVTGPLSGYYLSQIAAGQPLDSNCVDTGSDSAENLGMNSYTTRTDEKPDRKTVDMGYHHPFTPEAEPCRFCELVRDGIINFKDFAIFALNWLSEDCNPADKWCQHADVTFDTYVNFEDVELFAECWLVEDTYPPVPNPSEWEIEPYPLWSPEHPNSISMTAETTSDAWDFWVGNVQYYFDCVYGDCNDSGWQNDPNYIDPNLVVGVEYGYRVRASDASTQIPDDGTGKPGNKTGWSPIRYAVVGEVPPLPEDHDTPKPDPMTWASVPTAIGSTSITMTATTADDNTPPVEYYFEDVNFPTVNSGWQSSPTWVDTTCEPNTTYTYRVKARDGAIPHNETGWSDPCSATTTAEIPPNNPPAPVAWEVEPYETGSGLDAYANMTAQVAIDPEGSAVQYYFECVDIPSINSGWTTERVWNNVPIGRADQVLEFRFKVRDLSPDLKESGWSTSLPCY